MITLLVFVLIGIGFAWGFMFGNMHGGHKQSMLRMTQVAAARRAHLCDLHSIVNLSGEGKATILSYVSTASSLIPTDVDVVQDKIEVTH